MTKLTWTIFIALLVSVAAQAGPIANGDFETGFLAPWQIDEDPEILRDPKVTNGTEPGGIMGISGLASDDFAVLDTTLEPGNINGELYYTGIFQNNVTLNGIDGTLAFMLWDQTDPAVPDGNHSGLLLDNIRITQSATGDTLCFDWYALTKKDQQRNDYFQVLFDGQELFRFSYNDALMPTHDSGGGGGNNYGPFSYGTGWQSTCVTPEPVPEPGTLLLLGCGLVPVLRRRRR